MKKDPVLPKDIAIPKIQNESDKKKEKALLAIGKYNSLLKASPLPGSHLIDIFRTKEAETSTRLEGTYVTFQEVALEEASMEKSEISKTKKSNVTEAFGIIFALRKAKELLKDYPLNTKVIKAMHKELMLRVMQEQGVPGEFRTGLAGIGKEDNPRYVAPGPQYIGELMSDLEKYIHRNDNMSNIVKIAVVHAQFEIIHPFADGNGRTGRLLIPILMKQYELTDDYSFFISRYFEKHKDSYCQHLNDITKKKDWSGWINFFLDSVAKHAESETKIIEKLKDKYTDGEFLKFSNASSQHIKNFIFRRPFFTVPDLTKAFKSNKVPLKNSTGLGKMFEASKDLRVLEKGKGGRTTLFACPALVEILSESYHH